LSENGLVQPTSRWPRAIRLLFAGMMAAAAVMPGVPDSPAPAAVAFVLLFVVWVVAALPAKRRGRRPAKNRASAALTVFYLSLAISLPFSLASGVTPNEWVRAAVPFGFLAVYALFPALSPRDCQFILRSILFAVVCWLVKTLGSSVGEFASGEFQRITYVNGEFGVPFVMVGLPLLLFWGMRQKKLASMLLAAVLLLVVIATGYRSQALLVAALWIAYIVRQKRRRRFLLAAGTAAVALAAFSTFAATTFGAGYLSRFKGLDEEVQSSRAVEILYALTKFAESPLLGKGLGYPVPIAVNQFGVAVSARGDQQADHVGYVHNVWLYLAMDLGLLGLIAYIGFFATAIFSGLRRDRRKSDVMVAAVATVLILLGYFTAEGAFRQIQMNLILGTLCAVLVKGELESASDQ